MLQRLIDLALRPFGWEVCPRDEARPGLGLFHDLESETWQVALGRWGFGLERSRERKRARQERELAAWEAEEERAAARRERRSGARRAA